MTYKEFLFQVCFVLSQLTFELKSEYFLFVSSGYDTVAEWWLSEYEMTNEDQFATLWNQVKPLYEQIHAYVRGRLRAKYGEEVVSKRGPIPAHLLGK